jgi:cytochrome c-type biogenesis protein CcmF
MIAEIGLALLWLAGVLAGLQLVMGTIGLRKDSAQMLAGVRPIAMVQGVLVGLSFWCLITVFMQSDMSVKLVALNSHSAKPMLFKFAGTWGNHEGSMLLWVAVLGVSGGLIAAFERALKYRTHIATLAAQAAIALGFYGFLIFSSNPFERLNPVPVDGNGLNPLLQDAGLAFHPPTLYFGYVGMSVAFSFAVGALIERDVGPAFARAMRPWVLGAWIFLTIGITAGSYWAYYELGWGGWWFWDPVENASLMPWLATTALLHSVSVLVTRDGLRAWTVMLAVVAFSMSMVGTFLVRSGILTSVHSFATDPTRGGFLLALLVVYIGGAMTLFALRVGTVREGNQFDLMSREGALVVNNLLLSVILSVVLVGTLYPLVTEAMGQKISIGAPYFNSAAGYPALLLVVVMMMGPVMRWRRDEFKAVLMRIALPLLATALMLLALVLARPDVGILPFLGLLLAVGVGVGSFAPLWKRNLRRTPLFTYGMVIAHFGIAVSLAGMASESGFIKEKLVAANIGETNTVGPYTVKFLKIEPVAGQNWTAIEATLEARRGDGEPMILRPQSRMFSNPVTPTNEAAIGTVLDGQLYLNIGEPTPDGRWQLRMWWKPYVTLIWLGGILVAFGGFLSLIGRARREMGAKARRGIEAEAAPAMVEAIA